MTSARRVLYRFMPLTLVCAPIRAQQLCMEASSGFHVDGVLSELTLPLNITGVVGIDDGGGPALFVSGVTLASAGAEPSIGLAKWDGQQWRDTAVTVRVDDIAAYDDGNGAKLYVATGTAPRLSTWNGSSLVPLAEQPNGSVLGFDVIDLGSGPELYISGSFTQVGSTPAAGIARWNGSQWSAVTNGASVGGPFEAFDDGSGVKLYGISRVSACNTSVARLDVGGWTNIGQLATCGLVFDLQTHGNALYVAGRFWTAGGIGATNVARWNGTSWSAVGSGIASILSGVAQLASFDDGNGTALFAVGKFDDAPYGIRRFDGIDWQSVGAGIAALDTVQVPDPMGGQALGTFDDGSGERLVVAGEIQTAGNVGARNVAAWDGASWSGFGTSGEGIGRVHALAYVDDGSGPALYAGGAFLSAGHAAASHVARWDGSAWTALGTGVNDIVFDIESFDDGSGSDLYVAGGFSMAGGVPASNIARWDGAQWSAVGAGTAFSVYDLQPHGNLLYAALSFPPGVVAWNGSSWSTVGGGTNNKVFSLAIYDGDLFATGEFTLAGGVPVSGIARYDELTNTWSSAGTSIPISIESYTAVHDDGSGSALYVMTAIGGMRRLQGNTWTLLGFAGVNASDLASVDLGLGRPSLVVCNRFVAAGPIVPLRIWTGSSWVDMTSDTTDRTVYAIAGVPGSSSCAPELFVGGDFTTWGGALSHGIAKLTLCGEPGVGYCFGDGSTATPCPCIPPNVVPNPPSAPGHGCANSFNLDGAKLCAVGTTNPDTVTLRASGLTFGGFTQFVKGDDEVVGGIAYADGVRCVGGAIVRFGNQNAVLGTAYYPNPSLGLNAPLSNAGTPPGSGLTGHYQAIYRNAAPNFCTVDTLNVTNAVKITW